MKTDLVTDRSAWTGSELEIDRSWEFELSAEHRDDLLRALDRVQEGGLELAQIEARHFPLPSLGPLIRAIAAELQHGRGFALLHGFPVDDHDRSDIEKLYWGLCSHLGTGITQNGDASLIHYVTDGALRPNQGSRGVGRPGPSGLHVDLTDCASLLCIRQAADSPPSWIGSSSQLHNEVLRHRPDDLAALYQGFQWDRMGEHRPEESATSGYLVPLFSEAEGRVSCRYNRAWIASASRRLSEPLTDAQKDVFDFLDERAHANRLEFPFERGDVQFVNNYAALHGRAGHAVEPDEAHKRLLMRIWIDFADRPPVADESIIRYGIVRHGNLGWTAAQLQAGIVDRCHQRDDAGRPLVTEPAL